MSTCEWASCLDHLAVGSSFCRDDSVVIPCVHAAGSTRPSHQWLHARGKEGTQSSFIRTMVDVLRCLCFVRTCVCVYVRACVRQSYFNAKKTKPVRCSLSSLV